MWLGAPVIPFYPFSFWVPLLKPNSRKKGTLIIKGLLGNLGGDVLYWPFPDSVGFPYQTSSHMPCLDCPSVSAEAVILKPQTTPNLKTPIPETLNPKTPNH